MATTTATPDTLPLYEGLFLYDPADVGSSVKTAIPLPASSSRPPRSPASPDRPSVRRAWRTSSTSRSRD